MKELAVRSVGTIGQMAKALDLQLAMDAGTTLLLLRHLIARRKVLCDMDAALNEALPVRSLTVAGPALRQRRAE